MPGVAGYKAQLKLGGVPTIFTDEPLTPLSDLVYRIDDEIKRVLSANHAVVIEDANDVVIVPDKINYLEGVILLSAPEIESLRISARYIPLLYIGGAKEYSCEIGGDVLDDTSFHPDSDTLSAGYRTKVCGIHDISVSFSRWNDFSNSLLDAKIAKTPIFVSVNPGASSTFIKGWFQIETDSLSGDIGSLESEDLSLVLCGNNSLTYFSYSYNYSDAEAIALAIVDEQDLIDNYFFAE